MAFFDNVGRKISQAGQGALQKTKEMADVARINSLIADEEKRLNNSYFQIGKLYAQLHSGDYEDCFAVYIDAVRESMAKIEELKAELQALRAVANCPHCGAEVPNSSSFCNICGTPMKKNEEQNPVPQTDSVKCTVCGNFVNKNMNFCTNCGTPMAQILKQYNQPEETPVAETAPVETPRCPYCSAEVDSDSVFCSECGKKIK